VEHRTPGGQSRACYFFDADFFRDDFLVVEDFLLADFLPADFLPDFFFADFLAGTFPPSLRASDNPIAIACSLLLTVLPEPPLLSLPRLRSCIALFTFSPAFLPYFAM
jgi:hypothetical protein